jgi:hypothetical protein
VEGLFVRTWPGRQLQLAMHSTCAHWLRLLWLVTIHESVTELGLGIAVAALRSLILLVFQAQPLHKLL